VKSKALTSAQIRAARALVRWSAADLAREAALGLATIRRAEGMASETSLTAANDLAIRRALEAAGVEFIEENGGGAGVRLRKPHQLSARASHGIASDDRFARRVGEPKEIITQEPNRIKRNLAITAEQLRGARGLLGWSQSELAARSGLSLPTVKRVESEAGLRVSHEARTRLKEALESAGVSFTKENGEGLGVYLRKRRSTPK
jgi:transcriptional regulator with XRE-family HTH domain